MIFLKYILYDRSLAYLFCNLQMSHIPKNYKWFDKDLALLSFLFDCLSFILWKGWNWQDWWWSHWTKHKGNCSIFHFLNKTKNIYFYLFATESLSEKETNKRQNKYHQLLWSSTLSLSSSASISSCVMLVSSAPVSRSVTSYKWE